MFARLGWYNEAEEEYKRALYYEENADTLDNLMYVEMMLEHSFLAIALGEKLRAGKEEVKNWTTIACNLTHCYIKELKFDAARLLIEECENDSGREYEWICEAQQILKERKKEVQEEKIDNKCNVF